MQCVFGTFERALQKIAGAFEGITASAFVMRCFDPCGDVRETALRPAQSRCRHARQQAAVELIRRESNRHADDSRSYALLTEQLPKRFTLPSHLDPWARQRNANTPKLQNATRRVHSRRG